MGDLEKKLLSILQLAVQNKASDIHLMTGQPPALRSVSGLTPVNTPPLTADEMSALIFQQMLTSAEQKAQLHSLQDMDGSFEVKGLGRFRYNIYRASAGLGVILRVVAPKVPTIDDLKLPESLKKISEAPRGLVLVTGATGSGKSSTLAAMIDHLNSTSALHILTIEDPIEFLHTARKCRLSQREIGRDTKSFAVALRSALRQDPDVIMVGELRDLETLDIALKAAETGHLVFSTVHTADAMKTIGRLVALFPAEEQLNARIRLADNLHAIISQRLLPGSHRARVVAQEIMVNNLGLAECIVNERKTAGIPAFIEKGQVNGMQTFDQHLIELVRSELITKETALANATSPADFERNVSFGNTALIQTEESEGPSLEASMDPQSPEAVPPLEGAVLEPPAFPPVASTPPSPPPRPGVAQLSSATNSATSIKIPKPPKAA
jgi:twitching motility protein PilT